MKNAWHEIFGENEIWPFVHFFTTLAIASYMPATYSNGAIFAGIVAAWEVLEFALAYLNDKFKETWANRIVSDGGMALCGWIVSRYVQINNGKEWNSAHALVHVYLTGLAGWIASWAIRRLKSARILPPNTDSFRWTLLFATACFVLINLAFLSHSSPTLQTIAIASSIVIFMCYQLFKLGPFTPLLGVTAALVLVKEF